MKHTLGLAVAVAAASFAVPALADPTVGFACTKPIVGVYENPAQSRYRITNEQERVFDIQVHVNEPAEGESISATTKRPGICRILLPAGAVLLRNVFWREPAEAHMNRGLFQSIQVHEATGAGAKSDWLLLTPRDPTRSGLVTMEFHIIYNFPDSND